MSHPEQLLFFSKVKCLYPDYFRFKNVVDIGSLDVNGNLRWLLECCNYVGVDIVAGNNVNIISPGHLFKPNFIVDTIVSAECFEHDPYFSETIMNMYSILKENGLMTFTCATTGRREHGPGPIVNDKMFYHNVTVEEVFNILSPEERFSRYSLEVEIASPLKSDLRFWGIKK